MGPTTISCHTRANNYLEGHLILQTPHQPHLSTWSRGPVTGVVTLIPAEPIAPALYTAGGRPGFMASISLLLAASDDHSGQRVTLE